MKSLIRPGNYYLIVGICAVIFRLLLNFHTELVPGLNGGYYPVQIRALLMKGSLAFSDMPLLFYFNFYIHKFIALFSIEQNTENLIIIISKIIDSIIFPTILVPLFLIRKRFLKTGTFFPIYEFGLIVFLTLSFSPLYLNSDFQKNAFALPLLVFLVYFFLVYLEKNSLKFLAFSLLMLTLIGLTHFGVFVVSSLFILSSLLVFFNRRLVIPFFIITVFSALLIYWIDAERFQRLLSSWERVTGPEILVRPIMYPHGTITNLFSYLLISLSALYLFVKKEEIPFFSKKVLVILMIFVMIVSFPFLKFEWGRRLVLISFIPQTLLLLILYPYLSLKIKSIIAILLLVISVGSITYHIAFPKKASIDNESYQDLKKIAAVIDKPQESIIVTRHGLDWWIAWELKTNIAIHHTIDNDLQLLKNYNKVLIIRQKKGLNNVYPGKKSPFSEPAVPENSSLIYSSNYFDLFETAF